MNWQIYINHKFISFIIYLNAPKDNNPVDYTKLIIANNKLIVTE